MSLILLVLGILVTTAGVVSIGFGLRINDLSQLNTFILAGAFGVVGGLLLIGMWAVVAELHRVAAALRPRQPAAEPTQPVQAAQPARQSRPVEATLPSPETVAREHQPIEEPRVAAAPAGDTLAVERMRAAIPRSDKVAEAEDVPLSPNGQQAINGQQVQNVEPPPDPAPRSPAGAGVEAVREPRLDFLFRQRQARPAPPQPEFDTLWPKRARRDAQSETRAEAARAPALPPAIEGSAAAAEEVYVRPHPAAGPASLSVPAEEHRSVAILKSGVVDGMAYTLYADGSIEAQLPQGTVRFGSIAELRAHIENSSHG